MNFIPGFSKFPEVNIIPYNSPMLSRLNIANTENVYVDKDTISGEVNFNLDKFDLQEFDHQGITLELYGKMKCEDGYQTDIIHLRKDLEGPGVLKQNSNFGFVFKEVSLPFESYKGDLVEIFYELKATINKSFGIKSTDKVEIKILSIPTVPKVIPQVTNSICFANHISLDFKLLEAKIKLNSVITGSIKCKTCNINTSSVEIQLVKRETLIGIVFIKKKTSSIRLSQHIK